MGSMPATSPDERGEGHEVTRIQQRDWPSHTQVPVAQDKAKQQYSGQFDHDVPLVVHNRGASPTLQESRLEVVSISAEDKLQLFKNTNNVPQELKGTQGHSI
jgi:hypothetical protein